MESPFWVFGVYWVFLGHSKKSSKNILAPCNVTLVEFKSYFSPCQNRMKSLWKSEKISRPQTQIIKNVEKSDFHTFFSKNPKHPKTEHYHGMPAPWRPQVYMTLTWIHLALQPPGAKNCLDILKRVVNQNDGSVFLHRSWKGLKMSCATPNWRVFSFKCATIDDAIPLTHRNYLVHKFDKLIF